MLGANKDNQLLIIFYEPIKPEIIDKQTGPDQIIETLELFNYNQSDLISRIENGRTACIFSYYFLDNI